MISQTSPAYIHTLTTAFASTLDEIPQDMCRHFADLRELDAVLTQSLSGITKRIEELTQRIEGSLASEPATTEEQVISMFQLLHEIADDTGRIKLGGEDKIRVASLAAEHMNAYHSHLLNLVRKMHSVDSSYAPEILSPHTVYPHVPPSALVDPAPENRRGAPRRTVAVQNNSYGMSYAPMSAQGQNGAYHSSHRNESTGRGVNGDTPTKRRRIQAPIASSSAHHSQLHGTRDRDMDTDDSTPRRGVSALDAEAYRPGGNTANRARTHGRKGREAPTPMDGNGMQGTEPGATNHGQLNGVSSHKSQLQNGRSRGSSSQHHRTNPNPQPQQYPMHYQQYAERNHASGNRFVDPPGGTGYGGMGASYPQTANLNPIMDTAYHHHHSAMNMNPNLNHLPPNANYSNAMGMGMVIPTSLPPPPGTAHGRPSSASVSGRNSYDAPPPRSAGNSRQEGTGSSASGGLMPLPMLTSLPPAGVLTHPNHAPHPSHIDPALSRSRGYGSTQSYSGNAYGAPDTNQNPLPPPVSHHPHTTYTSSHPSSLPPTHASQPAYAGNSTSNPTVVDKGASKPDVHPSLVIPSSNKEALPSSLHSRGPSIPTSAGGTSMIHSSLATREPPHWGDAAGPDERIERNDKPNVASKARSDTLDGGTVTTAAPAALPRHGDEPTEPRPVPVYERISPSIEQRDRDREAVTLAGQGSQPPSGSVQPSGGTVLSRYPTKSLASVKSFASISLRAPVFDKVEVIYGSEDEDFDDAVMMRKKPHTMPDHSASDRDRERERQGTEADVLKAELDSASRDGLEKAVKTPTRREAGEEGPPPFDSSSPFKFIEGASGDITEGLTVDEDSKPYCVCGRPSFGQMIGCDDSECEFEWFHLDCLGITGTPPQGEFMCPYCKTRRSKGNRKSNKKKSTFGRRGPTM